MNPNVMPSPDHEPEITVSQEAWDQLELADITVATSADVEQSANTITPVQKPEPEPDLFRGHPAATAELDEREPAGITSLSSLGLFVPVVSEQPANTKGVSSLEAASQQAESPQLTGEATSDEELEAIIASIQSLDAPKRVPADERIPNEQLRSDSVENRQQPRPDQSPQPTEKGDKATEPEARTQTSDQDDKQPDRPKERQTDRQSRSKKAPEPRQPQSEETSKAEQAKPKPEHSNGSDPESVAAILPFRGDHDISSEYGMRKHPIAGEFRSHEGTDFAVPAGTPLVAVHDAKVVYNGMNGTHDSGYGNTVMLYAEAHDVTFVYAHLGDLKGFEIGDTVEAGEVIGLSGASGSATGPHLHFEIRKGRVRSEDGAYLGIDNAKPVNPAPYLSRGQAEQVRKSQQAKQRQQKEREQRQATAKEKPQPILPAAIAQSQRQALRDASAEYDVDVRLLAAIHRQEQGPNAFGEFEVWPSSYTGAEGPFQFTDGTWEGYAEDADGDGWANINSFRDAAFAAAHYLHDLGADSDMNADEVSKVAVKYNAGPYTQRDADGNWYYYLDGAKVYWESRIPGKDDEIDGYMENVTTFFHMLQHGKNIVP